MLDLLVVLVLLVDSKQNETVRRQSRFFRKKFELIFAFTENLQYLCTRNAKSCTNNKL